MCQHFSHRRPHSPINPPKRRLQPLTFKYPPNLRLHLRRLPKARQKSVRSNLCKPLPIHRARGLQYRPSCVKTQNRIPYPCFFENTPTPIRLSQPTMMP